MKRVHGSTKMNSSVIIICVHFTDLSYITVSLLVLIFCFCILNLNLKLHLMYMSLCMHVVISYTCNMYITYMYASTFVSSMLCVYSDTIVCGLVVL